MATAQKLVAVFLFVLVASTEAGVYRDCFDPCLPACIDKGHSWPVCEQHCDVTCTAKGYAAGEFDGMLTKSPGNKDHKKLDELKNAGSNEEQAKSAGGNDQKQLKDEP
nr:uncharacterized protein LOC109191228 [Ipomoea trifida]